MPRILIVDDSVTARLGLRQIIEEAGPDLQVVGEASSGARAVRMARDVRPDLITMDVSLGDDDGVEVTATLMATVPTPILVVTGGHPEDPKLAFRALDAGALDVLAKPSDDAGRLKLVRTIRALAGVPVVTRRRRTTEGPPRPSPAPVGPAPEADLVVLGTSTGGPPLLHDLLRRIPAPLGVPVAVVQHIVGGFARGLADWLADTTPHRVVLCDGATALEPGTVYVAPDDAHLRLQQGGCIGPQPGARRRFYRPSVDELFESALPRAPSAVAVLCTGMGDDGVAGMLALRRAGARTIAQSPATCVVDSMPARAIEAGAATQVLSPERIAAILAKLGGASRTGKGDAA